MAPLDTIAGDGLELRGVDGPARVESALDVLDAHTADVVVVSRESEGPRELVPE